MRDAHANNLLFIGCAILIQIYDRDGAAAVRKSHENTRCRRPKDTQFFVRNQFFRFFFSVKSSTYLRITRNETRKFVLEY